MNNENLKGHGFDEITAEEQREIAKKGAKASVEARKKKKLLRECLDVLLQREAGHDSKGNPLTTAEIMSTNLVKAAMNNDWKAWELVRDTAGQKPVEKVEVAEVSEEIVDEIESIVLEDD